MKKHLSKATRDKRAVLAVRRFWRMADRAQFEENLTAGPELRYLLHRIRSHLTIKGWYRLKDAKDPKDAKDQ